MRIVAQLKLYRIRYATISGNSAILNNLDHKNALYGRRGCIIDVIFQIHFLSKLRSELVSSGAPFHEKSEDVLGFYF